MQEPKLTLSATKYRDQERREYIQITAQCPCGRGGWIRVGDIPPIPTNEDTLPKVSDSSIVKKLLWSAKREMVQALAQPMADYLERKRELTSFIYDNNLDDALNVYVDLHGHIRPRKNPTSGLYRFDGQIFYKKKGVRNA